MTEMEAAMLQLVDMMREQQVKLDAMHGLVMELVKRELRESYPRLSRNKPLSSQGDERKMKRPGKALASPTRPDHNAVAEGQAS